MRENCNTVEFLRVQTRCDRQRQAIKGTLRAAANSDAEEENGAAQDGEDEDVVDGAAEDGEDEDIIGDPLFCSNKADFGNSPHSLPGSLPPHTVTEVRVHNKKASP